MLFILGNCPTMSIAVLSSFSNAFFFSFICNFYFVLLTKLDLLLGQINKLHTESYLFYIWIQSFQYEMPTKF
jgi:hypothetical protein